MEITAGGVILNRRSSAGRRSRIEERSMRMKKKVIKIKGRATVSVKTDEDD